MKKITLEALKKLNACTSQLGMFQELFPSGEVIPTVKLAEKYAEIFDWWWAAKNLLSPSSFDEYEKIVNAAYHEYNNIYNAAYNNAAWNEFLKIRDSALNEYKKLKAIAFVTLWIRENEK